MGTRSHLCLDIAPSVLSENNPYWGIWPCKDNFGELSEYNSIRVDLLRTSTSRDIRMIDYAFYGYPIEQVCINDAAGRVCECIHPGRGGRFLYHNRFGPAKVDADGKVLFYLRGVYFGFEEWVRLLDVGTEDVTALRLKWAIYD